MASSSWQQLVWALHSGELPDAMALTREQPTWQALVAAFGEVYGVATPAAGDGPADPAARGLHDLAQVRLWVLNLGEGPDPEVQGGTPWGDEALRLAQWLRGDPVVAPPGLASDAALRVEQMCLRSLIALAAGDLDVATRHARQATRAAYAESLRGQELFAYWVLARVRRCSGNIYAAARILGALARAAPKPWWSLVDWELALAGGDPGSLERPFTEPAATWLRLSKAAENGDREGWSKELVALKSWPLAPRFGRERDALCAGLAEEGAVDLHAQREVAGALYESAERTGRTPAVWRIAPQSRPRLLWCAVVPDPDAAALFEEGERVRTLVAALAQAGAQGVALESLFANVYGFTFDPPVHDGIFRVLLHRARAALGERAEITRHGDRIALVPRVPLLLPEPRSEPPFGDRILRLIAAEPGRTAKELAERSGTSVRGVQRALRLLLETGACRSERAGRKTTYTVEDTTFREPTHFRGARP